MVAKMNAKRLLVSFCTIAIAILMLATVTAAAPQITNTSDVTVEIDGITAYDGTNTNEVSVIAGETVTVKVFFDATVNVSASDVRIKAEIEGDKIDVYAMSKPFNIEDGKTYKKTLSLKVPFELKDDLSDNVTLNLKIWNGDYKTEIKDIVIRVQRPSYNPVVKSINTPQSINAGESFPVDLVLKNIGYNDLDDLYVTVSISELGVQKTSYFGDLINLEQDCDTDDDDCDDTVNGRISLDVPFSAESGIYDLEVEIKNDDVVSTIAKQIVIKNDLSKNIIVSSSSSNVAVGQDAEYNLLIVNPTDNVKVYTIVSESNGQVSSNAESTVIAVPAGSSKTVKVTANADSIGEYTFDVSVLSGDSLVDSVTLNLSVEGNAVASPIVVLTVVLAIIFLVLLVVLIVLVGKKSKKQEEFGESYY